jgi:membrane dipeptidase
MNRRTIGPVIDAHADTIGRFLKDPDAFHRRGREGHLDGPRMAEAGVNLQVMAVYTPPERSGAAAMQYALDFIAAIQAVLDSPANHALANPFRLVRSARDLQTVCKPGRRGFLVFIEGATPLMGRIENLDLFHGHGVRGLTLTHNHDNEAGGGCFAEGSARGLTPFGRELVPALEAAGMTVDLAHANEALFWDVLSLARRPLIDSHTGLRSFLQGAHPRLLERALSDEQAAAVAAGGGVVCVDFVPEHLGRPEEHGGRIGLAEIAAVIERMVELAGIDHVGLGSDWDGFPGAVSGLEDVTGLAGLRAALLAGGFSTTDVEKIFGRNLERVFAALLPAPQ